MLEPDSVRHHLADEARRLSRLAPVGTSAGPLVLRRRRSSTRCRRPSCSSWPAAACSVGTSPWCPPGGRLDHETSHYFGTSGLARAPGLPQPAARRGRARRGHPAGPGRAGDGRQLLPLPDRRPAPTGHPRGRAARCARRSRRGARRRLHALPPRAGRPARPGPAPARSTRGGVCTCAPTGCWCRRCPTPARSSPRRPRSGSAQTLPPRTTTGLPERLYVTRGTTPHTRRVVREEELRERLVRRGFTVFDPGRSRSRSRSTTSRPPG